MPRWFVATGRWARNHKLAITGIVIVGLLAITPIIIAVRTWGIIHPDHRPTELPAEPELEVQTERFTCGVHAVSTVYRAYGLDPEVERIRWRLGVDTKAVAWLPDSTGALHPDMYMVLAQDHFDIDGIDFSNGDPWQALHHHLASGHLAIFLIRRRENGHLHWVTA